MGNKKPGSVAGLADYFKTYLLKCGIATAQGVEMSVLDPCLLCHGFY